VISKAIDYDQPDVHLPLPGLITLGFVEKDSSQSPHVCRLTNVLLGGSADAA